MRSRLLILALNITMALNLMAVELPTVLGEAMPADDGVHVNVHGGSIVKDSANGIYYWYGEHRGSNIAGTPQLGVGCYSSTDLRNWTNRGIVLPIDGRDGTPLQRGSLIERPKVVYCPATGRWVLWFHHELRGFGYGAAYAGVATADNPLGPFKLLDTHRVNPGVLPMNLPSNMATTKWNLDQKWWTPEWYDDIRDGMFCIRDLFGGQMSRDMTIFVEDDKAYHVYSSEDNLTLQIAELDSTFTRHTGRYIRIMPGGHNEAPVLFKHDGTYWMITSGCTGWAPNEARLFRASDIMGNWEQLPNPCRGEGADKTFGSQGTYMFVEDGDYTFMADMWNPENLCDSRHLWLPVKFDNNNIPYLIISK
ncbi:MAG: glycoside hydrolase family 43 protein [Muribaculum sp.]|nr:glycoside hydrolase family 43 protein [Muribaculaceae bacterium]MCM1081634.1 glycoside hydrolase family 43 protein [Muribaculum sp.]